MCSNCIELIGPFLNFETISFRVLCQIEDIFLWIVHHSRAICFSGEDCMRCKLERHAFPELVEDSWEASCALFGLFLLGFGLADVMWCRELKCTRCAFHLFLNSFSGRYLILSWMPSRVKIHLHRTSFGRRLAPGSGSFDSGHFLRGWCPSSEQGSQHLDHGRSPGIGCAHSRSSAPFHDSQN